MAQKCSGVSAEAAEEEVPPTTPAAAEDFDSDPFDRQRCIEGWDQALVEKQRALVLGVGAVGCAAAQFLCRAGVGKVVLLDKDVVVASNLNRQTLYGPADVGRRKVDAAAECLRRYHVACARTTEVCAVHTDAVAHWDTVVALARDATAIFNCIDVGQQFDYAVMALGQALGVPVLMPSSFSYQWMAEFFTGRPAATSLGYNPAECASKAPFDRLTPESVVGLAALDFIVPDPNPPTRSLGSCAFVAVTAGMVAAQMWVLSLFGHPMPNFVKGDIKRVFDEGLLVFPQQQQ